MWPGRMAEGVQERQDTESCCVPRFGGESWGAGGTVLVDKNVEGPADMATLAGELRV